MFFFSNCVQPPSSPESWKPLNCDNVLPISRYIQCRNMWNTSLTPWKCQVIVILQGFFDYGMHTASPNEIPSKHHYNGQSHHPPPHTNRKKRKKRKVFNRNQLESNIKREEVINKLRWYPQQRVHTSIHKTCWQHPLPPHTKHPDTSLIQIACSKTFFPKTWFSKPKLLNLTVPLKPSPPKPPKPSTYLQKTHPGGEGTIHPEPSEPHVWTQTPWPTREPRSTQSRVH